MVIRRYLKLSGVVFLLAMVSFWSMQGANEALAVDKVKFALDWVPYGKHSMFYASLDKGFWKDAGFDVTILRGYGSGDTAKRIGAGSEEFGIAGIGAMLTARAKGAPLKMIGMYHDKALDAIATIKGTGITKPADLVGKKIGSPEGHASRVIFPAWARINNVDPDKVIWVNMTGEAQVPSMMAGTVDAMVSFYTEKPTIDAAAKKTGKEAVYLLYSDYGLDTYANGLITTDDLIKKNPDLVKRFVQSTYKGMAWSIENQEEAVDIFIKHNPAITRDLAMGHFEIAIEHILTPFAAKEGIGWMETKKMELTNNLITEYMKLPKKMTLEEINTNEYLPKLFPKPKKK